MGGEVLKNYGPDPENEAQWRTLDEIGQPWCGPRVDDWLLAIDDTDNLESRGTGFLARQLAVRLAQAGIANVKAITRHQLLVDPRIPYTSHNSSACLVLDHALNPSAVFAFTCDYLLKESAEGSDAGTVLIQRQEMTSDILTFARAAKVSVLTQEEAKALAATHHIPMAGLTGTGGGVIGALAATGLNATGHDGRFLWVKQLRSLSGQCCAIGELRRLTGVRLQDINDGTFTGFAEDDVVNLGEWPRAVFLNQHPTLLVERQHESRIGQWRSAAKSYVKQF